MKQSSFLRRSGREIEMNPRTAFQKKRIRSIRAKEREQRVQRVKKSGSNVQKLSKAGN